MEAKVKNFAAFTDAETPLEAAHNEIAYRAALEGIVLLENDGCLPIKPGKIALYGAGAAMTIKGGTGSGEVNERHAVSVMEGLENAGFTVTTQRWIDEYARLYKEGEEAYGREFKKKLSPFHLGELFNLMSNPYQYPVGGPVTEQDIAQSDTDTCIYVVSRQAGEGADRKLYNGDNKLSETEVQNIAICARVYAKMIVVINVGSSFDMNFVDEIEGINAVIFLCQQGGRGGQAFADLISGKVSPSGKLADTWAKRYEDIPFANEYSYLNGNLEEEYYKEGIYVGYRYFDSFQVEPKYHFGYGLSYTNFAITPKSVTTEQTKVKVCVEVINTGDTYAGKEVVQLYVSCPQKKLAKEYQRLVAFEKTRVLLPGESETITLEFDMASAASYDESEAAKILEGGAYILRVGNASNQTHVCGVVDLERDVILVRTHYICQQRIPFEEIEPAVRAEEVIRKNVPHVSMEAAVFVTRTCVYENPAVYVSEETDRLLGALTLEEEAELTVGSGMLSGGTCYFEAPGAAGSTTGKLLAKNIPNICVADGPAGLRLQRTSAVTKKGKVKMVDAWISLMNYLPGWIKKFMFGDIEKDTLIYQFATAFPVGLALAQTWNTDLVEEVGYAVSEEMKAYGVSYWLAPALNIHRNPLCGRNFEYYSEDPLVSGKMAAAITKGVQRIPGNYVTIKHFCCNNQEDNRNKTNANVSERALREIYLRGFEIVVEEAHPGAVMSSYNKVNGTYVNNSYELLTKVLRNEWGFDGLVMTDWYATGKELGDDAKAIAAGNDLIMPGSKAAKKRILAGVKDGTVSEEDIRRCAANVLKGIVSTDIYRIYAEENNNTKGR